MTLRGYRSGFHDRPPGSRSAFTLIELLTTISIVGLLVALVIPAVQSARGAARRSQCANNLRQIGLGTASYVSSFGVFPGAINGRGYSPLSVILPYLDQRPLFDALNFHLAARDNAPSSPNSTAIQTTVDVFLCPSDRPRSGVRQWSGYAANRGVYRRDNSPDNGAFVAPRGFASSAPASFTDGMSTTVSVSEWVLGPSYVGPQRDPKGTVFETPDQLIAKSEFERFAQECHRLDPGVARVDMVDKGADWHVGGYRHTSYNHILGPNDHSCTTAGWVLYGAYTATSRHAGGVNLIYADGHARFSTQNVDIETWRAVGTKNGGEVVGSRDF